MAISEAGQLTGLGPGRQALHSGSLVWMLVVVTKVWEKSFMFPHILFFNMLTVSAESAILWYSETILLFYGPIC